MATKSNSFLSPLSQDEMNYQTLFVREHFYMAASSSLQSLRENLLFKYSVIINLNYVRMGLVSLKLFSVTGKNIKLMRAVFYERLCCSNDLCAVICP